MHLNCHYNLFRMDSWRYLVSSFHHVADAAMGISFFLDSNMGNISPWSPPIFTLWTRNWSIDSKSLHLIVHCWSRLIVPSEVAFGSPWTGTPSDLISVCIYLSVYAFWNLFTNVLYLTCIFNSFFCLKPFHRIFNATYNLSSYQIVNIPVRLLLIYFLISCCTENIFATFPKIILTNRNLNHLRYWIRKPQIREP